MTGRLIIRPDAEQDIIDARDWYENRQPSLGGDFLTAIETVFNRIRESPELYAAEYRGVRRVGVRRFPYVVYYRIVGDDTEVIAVQHASRHPRGWQLRL